MVFIIVTFRCLCLQRADAVAKEAVMSCSPSHLVRCGKADVGVQRTAT
jgi:hypothetical protein